MARYLESGMRRDCCAIIYDAGPLRSQSVKRRLEDHYGSRVNPDQFRERLEQLVSTGHVERTQEGVQDVYDLTEAGEAALLAHADWLSERLATPSGE